MAKKIRAKQFRLSDQSMIGFVATSDPDGAKKFYRDILGLPLLSEEMPFALVLTLTVRCCG